MVVDDHAVFRSGVKTELAGAVDVVGEAADVAGAVEVITRLSPDVVLLDVHLPGGGGVEVLRQVRDQLAGADVIGNVLLQHPLLQPQPVKRPGDGRADVIPDQQDL